MEGQSYAANCGLFWVANSIVSTIMGTTNRSIHEEAAQRNLDFQRELEDARNIAQDEIEAEKIAFKRRVMKLSRQYRQTESAEMFDQQLKTIELQSFIEKYWPLAPALPNIILNEIEQSKHSSRPLPLNVVLQHAPLLPPKVVPMAIKAHSKDSETYKELERKLEINLRILGDVKLRKDSCINTDFVGGNANMMNIHFLMGGLPTLVISPKYNNEGKMIFNAAVWEAQAIRPLIRPLFSISYEPLIAERDEEYFKQAIEKIETALTVIVGATRDSYMLLTQGKAPMLNSLLDEKKKAVVEQDKALRAFVKQEYDNIVNALDTEYSPKLLEAYSKEDVESMKSQAHNMSLTF